MTDLVGGSMVLAFVLLVAAGSLWQYIRQHAAHSINIGFCFLAAVVSLIGVLMLVVTVVSAAALPNGKALATLPLGKQQVVCVAEDGENLLLVGTGVEVTKTDGRKAVPLFYAVPSSTFVSRTACRGETLTLAVADEGGKNRIIRILQ